MPRKRQIKLRCPICKKPANAADPDFPFCSERCRLIDLGNWSAEKYVVSEAAESEAASGDEDE